MSREHAKHNETLCDFIAESGEWPDWVVTTAFYAALHYVRAALFPRIVDDREYANFDVYWERTREEFRQDKHQRLCQLVFEVLNPGYDAYRFLMNEAKTARYNEYRTPAEIADRARRALQTLKAMC
jgi:hypothetical protein